MQSQYVAGHTRNHLSATEHWVCYSADKSVRRWQIPWQLACLCLIALCLTLGLNPTLAQAPKNVLPQDIKTQPSPVWTTHSAIPTNAPTPTHHVRFGVHYLLFDYQIFVNELSEPTYYTRVASKILNPSGVERASQINLDYDPNWQTLSLHDIYVIRDGKHINKLPSAALKILNREDELDQLIYVGRQTLNIILEDIRVGDILTYSYSRTGMNPVYRGLFSYTRDLNWSVPVAQLDFRILWQKKTRLNWSPHNTTTEVKETQLSEGSEYRIQLTDIPAKLIENNTPSWYDPWASITFTEVENWQAAAQWAVQLYQDVYIEDHAIKALVAQIKKDHDHINDQIVAALNFVQDEIRYLSLSIAENSHTPNPAPETLQLRYGDCKDKTVLLLTILKALGISGAPALVNTDLQHTLTDRPADIRWFDHVIAHIEHEGRSYWLDPTNNYQYGTLDKIHQPNYGAALLVHPNTTDLTRIDKLNNIDGMVYLDQFTVPEDTKRPVIYNAQAQYAGRDAESRRARHAGQSLAQQKKDYLKFYRKYYPNIEMKGDIVIEDNTTENLLTQREHYEIPNFWTDHPEKQKLTGRFYANLIDDRFSAPSEQQRHDPLALWWPDRASQEIRIHFESDNWQFDDEDFSEDNRFFKAHYQARYDETQRILTLKYAYENKVREIAPEDFTEFRKAKKNLEEYTKYGIQTFYGEHGENNGTPPSQSWLAGINFYPLAVVFGCLYALGILISLLYAHTRQKPDTGHYHPVSLLKFTCMWVSTMGLYAIYWFGKNYHYIKQTERSMIMPWWRGVFCQFWYYPLWQNVCEHLHLSSDTEPSRTERWLTTIVGIVLATLFLLSLLSANLGVYALIALVVSALIVIPLANMINHINAEDPALLHHNSRWRPHNIMIVLAGVPLSLFIIAQQTVLIPNGQVINGEQIYNHDLRFMEQAGILEPEDRIIWFYSDANFFIQNDGNGLTDRHVFSYWKDEDGKLNVELAEFDKIKDINTNGKAHKYKTVITVIRQDSSSFKLYVAKEDNQDRTFIRALRKHIQSAQATKS